MGKVATKSLSRVWTTCYSNGELKLIEIQVLVRSGIPRFDIIGLPENVIREGKDRILSTLSALGVELPSQKILVSLNPGDLPKEGSHFDLPILMGILKALGLAKIETSGKEFYWGELGLDGSIRPLEDILAHLLFASAFQPGKMISGGRSLSLEFVLPYLSVRPKIIADVSQIFLPDSSEFSPPMLESRPDHCDLQQLIFRNWIDEKKFNSRWNHLKGSPEQFLFWVLAAIGKLHILVEGAPGVGKSSWCYAFPELRPPLPISEWTEKFALSPNLSSSISSLAEMFSVPFEAPHHSSTKPAIVGGGSGSIAAGAITRAHRGILFLDEFNEFPRDVLESLREPLENRTITIARKGLYQHFPADIQLLAAMNACRCGYHESKKLCECSTSDLNKYRAKLSGPLIDRFHAHVMRWNFEGKTRPNGFDLQEVRSQIIDAVAMPYPNLSQVTLPFIEKPRRQLRWLEFFVSWCRWFGITQPSMAESARFTTFLDEIEKKYEGDGIYGNKHTAIAIGE